MLVKKYILRPLCCVPFVAALADAARAMLKKFGIGINDAENGVFLPANLKSVNPSGAAVHSTVHTEEYFVTVNSMLGGASTRQEAVDILSDIRQSLLAGGL